MAASWIIVARNCPGKFLEEESTLGRFDARYLDSRLPWGYEPALVSA
ncbi:MAG: hypothetical protein ACI9JM_001378 [Halioglobus sp.]|jgi:hypothetical protein